MNAPAELKPVVNEHKAAEQKLMNLYTPAALAFLYNAMNDTSLDMDKRFKAAEILAVNASIPYCEED